MLRSITYSFVFSLPVIIILFILPSVIFNGLDNKNGLNNNYELTSNIEKISAEFYRIANLIIEIKKDKYEQLSNGEFKTILKNIDMDLENIAKTEAGYWAKYIFINNEYVSVRAKGVHICSIKI